MFGGQILCFNPARSPNLRWGSVFIAGSNHTAQSVIIFSCKGRFFVFPIDLRNFSNYNNDVPFLNRYLRQKGVRYEIIT